MCLLASYKWEYKPKYPPFFSGNESSGLSPDHAFLASMIDLKALQVSVHTREWTSFLRTKGMLTVHTCHGSWLYLPLHSCPVLSSAFDKDHVQKERASVIGGLESLPSKQWQGQLDMGPGKRRHGFFWETLKGFQIENTINFSVELWRAGEGSIKFTWRQTCAQYKLKHFHNRGFLTADKLPSLEKSNEVHKRLADGQVRCRNDWDPRRDDLRLSSLLLFTTECLYLSIYGGVSSLLLTKRGSFN